jgi:hypothetical protein
MARFEHWERRLAALIDAASRLPFEWGRADCCLFAADAVWALTQRDPAAAWRGTYMDESGAMAIVARAGGLDALVETGLSSIGITPERIAPGFGQRGDVALFAGALGETLGVVEGAAIVARAPDGVLRVPSAQARIVWAIR